MRLYVGKARVRTDDGFVTLPMLRGEKGDTPKRGVDYYTSADKKEITDYIDAELDKIVKAEERSF